MKKSTENHLSELILRAANTLVRVRDYEHQIKKAGAECERLFGKRGIKKAQDHYCDLSQEQRSLMRQFKEEKAEIIRYTAKRGAK